MPFDLSLCQSTEVIELVFTDCVTIPERSDALREVVKAHSEHAYIRLLADFSQATTLVESESDMVAYADRLAQCWVLKPFSIAYVGDINARQAWRASPLCADTSSSGFFTREAAISWLT